MDSNLEDLAEWCPKIEIKFIQKLDSGWIIEITKHKICNPAGGTKHTEPFVVIDAVRNMDELKKFIEKELDKILE